MIPGFKSRGLAWLACLLLWGARLGLCADAASGTNAMSLDACRAVMANLRSVTDTEAIGRCIEYYWHHGDPDEPDKAGGGHQKIISLLYRSLELEPGDSRTYLLLQWLLYSRWTRIRQHPEENPGEDLQASFHELLLVLKMGNKANKDDAAYFIEAGMTIFQPYYPEFHDDVEQCFLLAWKCAKMQEHRIRTTLCLGNLYRVTGRREQAVHWYRETLKLEATNKSAVAYLKQLQGN